MKEYLKMADVFPSEILAGGDSGSLIINDVGIIIGCYYGDKMAEHVLHAINSHDELVAEVERLRGIISNVISTAAELSSKIATSDHGSGYIECAKDTANALSDLMQ